MESEELVSQSVHKGYFENLPLSHRGQSSISPAWAHSKWSPQNVWTGDIFSKQSQNLHWL